MKIARLFKELALGVVSAGSTLIIAACYGVNGSYEPDDWSTILARGRLTSETGDAIEGLRVCAEVEAQSQCTASDVLGDYSISVDQTFDNAARQNGFTLTIEDIDGETNGEYEDTSITVTSEEVSQGSNEIDVVVEAVEETEDE